jgi:hypothetical protein
MTGADPHIAGVHTQEIDPVTITAATDCNFSYFQLHCLFRAIAEARLCFGGGILRSILCNCAGVNMMRIETFDHG